MSAGLMASVPHGTSDPSLSSLHKSGSSAAAVKSGPKSTHLSRKTGSLDFLGPKGQERGHSDSALLGGPAVRLERVMEGISSHVLPLAGLLFQGNFVFSSGGATPLSFAFYEGMPADVALRGPVSVGFFQGFPSLADVPGHVGGALSEPMVARGDIDLMPALSKGAVQTLVEKTAPSPSFTASLAAVQPVEAASSPPVLSMAVLKVDSPSGGATAVPLVVAERSAPAPLPSSLSPNKYLALQIPFPGPVEGVEQGRLQEKGRLLLDTLVRGAVGDDFAGFGGQAKEAAQGFFQTFSDVFDVGDFRDSLLSRAIESFGTRVDLFAQWIQGSALRPMNSFLRQDNLSFDRDSFLEGSLPLKALKYIEDFIRYTFLEAGLETRLQMRRVEPVDLDERENLEESAFLTEPSHSQEMSLSQSVSPVPSPQNPFETLSEEERQSLAGKKASMIYALSDLAKLSGPVDHPFQDFLEAARLYLDEFKSVFKLGQDGEIIAKWTHGVFVSLATLLMTSADKDNDDFDRELSDILATNRPIVEGEHLQFLDYLVSRVVLGQMYPQMMVVNGFHGILTTLKNPISGSRAPEAQDPLGVAVERMLIFLGDRGDTLLEPWKEIVKGPRSLALQEGELYISRNTGGTPFYLWVKSMFTYIGTMISAFNLKEEDAVTFHQMASDRFIDLLEKFDDGVSSPQSAKEASGSVAVRENRAEIGVPLHLLESQMEVLRGDSFLPMNRKYAHNIPDFVREIRTYAGHPDIYSSDRVTPVSEPKDPDPVNQWAKDMLSYIDGCVEVVKRVGVEGLAFHSHFGTALMGAATKVAAGIIVGISEKDTFMAFLEEKFEGCLDQMDQRGQRSYSRWFETLVHSIQDSQHIVSNKEILQMDERLMIVAEQGLSYFRNEDKEWVEKLFRGLYPRGASEPNDRDIQLNTQFFKVLKANFKDSMPSRISYRGHEYGLEEEEGGWEIPRAPGAVAAVSDDDDQQTYQSARSSQYEEMMKKAAAALGNGDSSDEEQEPSRAGSPRFAVVDDEDEDWGVVVSRPSAKTAKAAKGGLAAHPRRALGTLRDADLNQRA